jgi:hypothetical protein
MPTCGYRGHVPVVPFGGEMVLSHRVLIELVVSLDDGILH